MPILGGAVGGTWVVLGLLASAGVAPATTPPPTSEVPVAAPAAPVTPPAPPQDLPHLTLPEAPATQAPAELSTAPAPAPVTPALATAPAAQVSATGPEAPTGSPEVAGEPDPWARPFFVKGDLNSFSVRPGPRRNFIGVAGGLSAVPSSADAVINAFYLTIEPIIEINNPKYNWKLSLGAPLQFELADTRGAFEVCIGEAKALKAMGKDMSTVQNTTATCISRQKDRAVENLGKLRKADWDSASDFAKIIRHLVVGGQEQPFYLSLSRLYDQSFGHGTAVRHYNPNIDYNAARLGANIDLSKSAIGVQAMANDLVSPDVVGMLGFVRPFRPYSDNVFLRSLSLGASWVHGSNQPLGLRYERGLFMSSFDQPIPEVDPELHLMGHSFHSATIVGFDLESKVVRSNWADVKVYADLDKMLDYDSGLTLGSLFRLSFGQPARQALRARAEISFFGPAFLPNYFDTFHDIFQYQYLPAGYKASSGRTYYPTKLEFLEASRGGRRRIGGYFEVTHAIFDALTVGATVRGHTAYGSPTDASFVGPAFPDYAPNCTPDTALPGKVNCSGKITLPSEPGFGSLRLTAELPFRKFLQAYASYEAFSTTTEGGLGAFKFDGDNEVFFSGARMMLLPILFIQAEARRYFFLQRLSNVDVHNLTFDQDQNVHSLWTFAVNVSLGYEF
jgi:hypothetical protein